jgi:hypothetical protein
MSRRICSFLPLLVILMCASVAVASANNVYVSQSGTGGGTSCSDTRSASWFNASANWGSGSTQIGAGTTVHLCGTFTGSAGATEFTFQGSGSSANPIKLYFESGALLSAPYWGASGAIVTNGNSWLTIDGGTNGTIQNTANGSSTLTCLSGSACAYQQDSRFIYISGGGNIEVKNLMLSDVYIHDGSGNDTNDRGTNAIYFLGINNVTVDNNTCHDSNLCFDGWGNNISVNNNTAYNCAGAYWFGPNVATSGLLIYNNYFYGSGNWATTSDAFHLENIHLFPNSGSGNASGVVIYNNHLAGGGSCCNTAHLFMEGTFTSPQIFNNVFDNTPNYHMPGLELATTTSGGGWKITNPLVVNNTFLGGDMTFSGNSDFQFDAGVTGLTWQNNMVTGGITLASFGAGTFAAGGVNNSVYENIEADGGSGQPFGYDGNNESTFPNWKAALPSGSGQDSASVFQPMSSLLINADGTLQSGSPAIKLGANLTNLGITALNSDRNGVARPNSGAWDAGAYQFGAATGGQPNPPTGLVASVN